jgi:hypothetical protein
MDAAVTDTADSSVSLAVTAKAGTSIDPAAIGFPFAEDELSIYSIASRPTIMVDRVVQWDSADVVGTTLFNWDVHPQNETTGAYSVAAMTALSFATYPFRLWRGTLKLRIQIVCSRLHHGRLRATWTPQSGVASPALNVTYNHILDIGDGLEYEFEFPYVNQYGYQPTYLDGETKSTANTNGEFTLRVQNVLTAPDSTSAIYIIPWVYAGEDFELADPRETSFESILLPALAPQSDMSQAVAVEAIKFVDVPPPTGVDRVYVGDPIRSFRSLLKRYTTHAAVADSEAITVSSNTLVGMNIYHPLYPQRRGWTAAYATSELTADGSGYNLTRNHLANYLEICFLAKRGGFRWIFTPLGLPGKASSDDNPNVLGTVMVSRVANSATTVANFQFRADYELISDVGTSYFGRADQMMASTDYIQPWMMFSGTQVFTVDSGTGEWPTYELPAYNRIRYFTNMGCDGGEYVPEQSARLLYLSYVRTVADPTTSMQTIGYLSCAAAEDFTMHFFTGVPVLEVGSGPPPANLDLAYWSP